MNKGFVFIFMLVVGLMVTSCLRQSKQGATYDFTPLDSIISSWMDKGYYPGGAICVVKNDSVLFEKAYGSFTGDTKVYVASAGKWVAAAVIGAVVDRTDLSWDDPVEKWLPQFRGDAKGGILLRQLLSHTSGVRPSCLLPGWTIITIWIRLSQKYCLWILFSHREPGLNMEDWPCR